jgi:hypothetical protein
MSELTLSMWRDDMKYYEITNMDDPKGIGQTRTINEDELDRRIALAFEEATFSILDPNGVAKARDIIVYGKVKPAPEPVVEPATVPEQEALPETATGVDYAQVKAAVLKVSQEKGRAAAVELLDEFGAKVGGDLTEEQWGPFLACAAEVLA